MLNDKRKGLKRPDRNGASGNVLRLPLPETRIQRRLIDASGQLADAADDIAFQHSILCQTSLPYRNPGDDTRDWMREQGNAALLIEAGRAHDAETGKWINVGLPWGPKARLILMHLNSAAIRTQNPEIDVGDSLTDFVKRIGLTTDGRTIRMIKDQVGALSTAMIRMAFHGPDGGYQMDAKVVSGFDLWFSNDPRQKVLWPSIVRLSPDYFQSLQSHAVPLDERAVGALSHSAMALDIYAWLAQRLHRVPSSGQFISWAVLQGQFGHDYARVRKFREVFLTALRQVHVVYPAAKLDISAQGLFLYTAPPPILKTGVTLRLPSVNP